MSTALTKWISAIDEGKLEGWLMKQSHESYSIFRRWQMRYFVLDFKKKALRYYIDDEMKQMVGEYILQGSMLCEVRDYGFFRTRQHQIAVSGLSRGNKSTLYMYSDTMETINMWFAALRYAIKVIHKLRIIL